jgi:Protein of unknown function (DUF2637)
MTNPFRRLLNATDERMHDRQVRRTNKRRARQAPRPAVTPAPPGTSILRGPRRIALTAIAVLIGAASGVSFAESYRGLYEWAAHHGLTGVWAYAWPCQVDTFIAVGELALFVALVDQWQPRSRTAAWLVTAAGLVVSVLGNVGHVAGHTLAVRATAAVPPLAAASALAVGMGVLKRIVEKHHQESAGDAVSSPLHGADDIAPEDALQAWLPGTVPGVVSSPVPLDAESAALIALKATLAAGNSLSLNQLMTRFRLTRSQATKVRQLATAEANGHNPEAPADPGRPAGL